jgi:hypothetical protein
VGGRSQRHSPACTTSLISGHRILTTRVHKILTHADLTLREGTSHWGSAVVRLDIGWSDSATSVETLVKGCQRDARTH